MSFRVLHAATLLLGVVVGVRPIGAQINLFQTGTLYNSPAVNQFATGASMAGMEVRWWFPNLTSGFASWGDIGGGGCGVNSGGFRVILGCADASGDANGWMILNTTGQPIVKVQFNGAPGRTVFDCSWDGIGCIASGMGFEVGTVDSDVGYTHTKVGGSFGGSPSGTYTNLVGLGGAPPVGDLFEQFELRFEVLQHGDSYVFRVDTDQAELTATSPPSTVPEPATWTMLAAGLAVMHVGARRRR
jgi:hypothetical protein